LIFGYLVPCSFGGDRARSLSLRCAHKSVDVRAAGKEPGVPHMLEGSFDNPDQRRQLPPFNRKFLSSQTSLCHRSLMVASSGSKVVVCGGTVAL
jgi:hypothetical protein